MNSGCVGVVDVGLFRAAGVGVGVLGVGASVGVSDVVFCCWWQ